jgi:hypothetical protein
MKKINFFFVGIACGLLCFLIFSPLFYFPTSAEKTAAVQWEYCAITASYIPANSENQASFSGAVNICYLQANGCRNEEVKAEVVYAKFLQDFRLENTEQTKTLGYNRAKDLAFSKAASKLGLEGWEIISQPSIEFDNYIPNNQGNFTVYAGSKETKPDVYFKRLKQ